MRFVFSLALLATLAGCAPRETSDLWQGMRNHVVSQDPFVVAPDRGWKAIQEHASWRLDNAAVAVRVLEPPIDEPFLILLRSNVDAASLAMTAAWDGEPLGGEAIRLIEHDGIEITVPVAKLTVGQHVLTLDHAPVRAEDGTEAAFHQAAYSFAGSTRLFEPAQVARYYYLSDFLLFGVTGSMGSEKLGGFLFDGPQAITRTLPGGGGSLSLRIHNSSFAGARFLITFDDDSRQRYWLRPHERHLVSLVVPAAARTVTLSTYGSRDGLFLWGAPQLAPAGGDARPPIVVITLDTTRRDALGAYGGHPGSSPHLTRLAESATVYEHAYATAPWTLPSHASMFTGLYPNRHLAGVIDGYLGPRRSTVAEQLAEAGYVTAGFAGGLFTGYRYGLAQGFGVYRSPDGLETIGDELIDEALAVMDGYRDRTFFLFVNLFDPHYPYQPPAEVAERYDLEALRAPLAEDPDWWQIVNGTGTTWNRLTAGEVTSRPPAGMVALQASYQAEIAFTDAQVGRLLDALREAGRFDDALIVVTSDHGELLGEGGYFSHSSRLDTELIDIPLIVKWPGQQAGRRVSGAVSLVDLAPTVLEAAGLESWPEIDGITLGAAGDRARADRPWIRFEEHESAIHPLFPAMRLAENAVGVQNERFRALQWADQRSCAQAQGDAWLDVACPPGSLEDLDTDVAGSAGPRAGLTDEEREKLRALGYIQ